MLISPQIMIEKAPPTTPTSFMPPGRVRIPIPMKDFKKVKKVCISVVFTLGCCILALSKFWSGFGYKSSSIVI